MTEQQLEGQWRAAAIDLSLDVAIPFAVQLSSGAVVTARVLVRGYGGRCGMLIVSDYSDVSSHQEELMALGYGFSVMDEPQLDEVYDSAEIAAVLRDWA